MLFHILLQKELQHSFDTFHLDRKSGYVVYVSIVRIWIFDPIYTVVFLDNCFRKHCTT